MAKKKEQESGAAEGASGGGGKEGLGSLSDIELSPITASHT